MNKKTLMGFILLAIIGTSAAFAQRTTFNGHQYQVFEDSKTWTDARAYCESLGGHLAAINSQAEQTFIEGLISKGQKNYYWVGGYCESNRVFRWVTGEPMTYTNWVRSEPNNFQGKQDKIAVYRVRNPKSSSVPYQWDDIANDGLISGEPFFSAGSFGFICEWEQTPGVSQGTASGGNGTFTLTGIPSAHNGKYASAAFVARGDSVLGSQSINVNTAVMTLPRVANGSVTIPLWTVNSSGSLVRYSGSDSVTVSVGFYNSENVSMEESDSLAVHVGQFASVRFSNGSASKSWGEGNTAAVAPASLNGVWEMAGFTVTVSGNNGVFNAFPPVRARRPVLQSAIDKGYYTIGSQYWRGITSAGNLRWSGQFLNIKYNTSNSNVATGTSWDSCTFVLSADGKTLTWTNGNNTETWTRQ